MENSFRAGTASGRRQRAGRSQTNYNELKLLIAARAVDQLGERAAGAKILDDGAHTRLVKSCVSGRLENEACPDRRVDHLVAERRAREIVETISGAMADQ